jgi:hypothetical protein
VAAIGALIFVGALIAAVVDHFIMGNPPKGTIIAVGFLGILLNTLGMVRNRRRR